MPSISGHVASVDVDRTVKMMLGCVFNPLPGV